MTISMLVLSSKVFVLPFMSEFQYVIFNKKKLKLLQNKRYCSCHCDFEGERSTLIVLETVDITVLSFYSVASICFNLSAPVVNIPSLSLVMESLTHFSGLLQCMLAGSPKLTVCILGLACVHYKTLYGNSWIEDSVRLCVGIHTCRTGFLKL